MNNKWKWIVAITVATVIVVAVLGAESTWLTANRYGMMNGYGWHMPMMYGGMMGSGMIFMWLIGLAVFVFLVLAIAWLVRELTSPKS
jgi:hypothetical protein